MRLRVLASDGFHTTFADSGDLIVPQKAPDVYIGNPVSDSLYRPGQAVFLSGSAYDPEDGPIPDAQLSWWSDRSGLLGRGTTVAVDGFELPVGRHILTLRASDSQCAVGSSRISIMIGYGLDLPLVLRS